MGGMEILMKKYYEKYISNQSGMAVYELAGHICGGERDNYYLYENKDVVSVGIGIHKEIIASPEEIVIQGEYAKQSVRVSELREDIDKVFRSMDVDGWRAYGIANFGLARHIYGMDLGAEAKELLHFVIPDREYRVKKDTILLRALNEEALKSMESNVRSAAERCGKEEPVSYYDGKEVLSFDRDYYMDIVRLAVQEIKDREYQKVILSRRIPVLNRLDMLKTYIHGRSGNTPARSYLYRFSNLEVAGFSPETVAEVDASGTVYTFPLAGTRALTGDPMTDKSLREELLKDPKESAEHAISVKLADEELAQVCTPDSVMVTEFMRVIERGTVQHLGSRLRGKLREGNNTWHAFFKLFPAVTASGIPKKEAIEAIGRIEKDPRNLYSGSVMTYDWDGTLDAALVLRSVFQNQEGAWVRVGAGIVEMSNPERELAETREKVGCISEQLVKELQQQYVQVSV